MKDLPHFNVLAPTMMILEVVGGGFGGGWRWFWRWLDVVEVDWRWLEAILEVGEGGWM